MIRISIGPDKMLLLVPTQYRVQSHTPKSLSSSAEIKCEYKNELVTK